MRAVDWFRAKRASLVEGESYRQGWNDALQVLTSDSTYYGMALSPGEYQVVQEAAEYVAEGDFDPSLI